MNKMLVVLMVLVGVVFAEASSANIVQDLLGITELTSEVASLEADQIAMQASIGEMGTAIGALTATVTTIVMVTGTIGCLLGAAIAFQILMKGGRSVVTSMNRAKSWVSSKNWIRGRRTKKSDQLDGRGSDSGSDNELEAAEVSSIEPLGTRMAGFRARFPKSVRNMIGDKSASPSMTVLDEGFRQGGAVSSEREESGSVQAECLDRHAAQA